MPAAAMVKPTGTAAWTTAPGRSRSTACSLARTGRTAENTGTSRTVENTATAGYHQVMSELVTTKTVAQALHVSPETVRDYARRGLIPSEATPGGHRRFDLGAVAEALDTALAHARVHPSEMVFRDGRVSVGRREQAGGNQVHAALMAWAKPATLPAGAGR
jgi:excisionase family DNA binding protein